MNRIPWKDTQGKGLSGSEMNRDQPAVTKIQANTVNETNVLAPAVGWCLVRATIPDTRSVPSSTMLMRASCYFRAAAPLLFSFAIHQQHLGFVAAFAPISSASSSRHWAISTIIRLDSTIESQQTSADLDHLSSYQCEILSQDPLIYTVFDVLSEEECNQFINRADTASSDELTRSNPPDVSLDVGKLWPLPFLCIGAGLPPVIRLFENGSGGSGASGDVASASISAQDVLAAALPPILIAAVIATFLAFGVTQFIRSQSNANSRTSDALALNMESDYDLISNLVSRVCLITGHHPWEQFEAPVLTRYQPGAVFATHNDASPTLGSEWADLGGQRSVTAITYLNDCPKGGGTRFDRLGITVQPQRGMTLVFYPADVATLAVDDRTRHESMDAVEEKYIVQMFGRVGRVPPPLGLPDSFGDDE